MRATRTETRTLRFDATGRGFVEGPVRCAGFGLCGLVVTAPGGSGPSTGAAEVKGAVVNQTEMYQSFSTPEVVTGVVYRRRLGEALDGIATVAFLDAFVTTAEAAKELRFDFYMVEAGE